MKILLINPSYFEETYKNSKHKIAVIQYPPLNLALLASYLKARNHCVEILDLNIEPDLNGVHLQKRIRDAKPDLIGLTMTSAQYSVARDIVWNIKSIDKNLKCIVGGPHVSALPAETIKDCGFDAAVIGEGEETLARLAAGENWETIPNLCYFENGKPKFTPRDATPLKMDDLEFPAWELFDLDKYRAEKIMSRRERVGPLETSRGCPWGCIYCNKNIFGTKFRYKSPQRVVDEIEHMLSFGFEEIHVIDDNFSTHLERAKLICEEILRRNLKIIWSPWNGLRVDRLDLELLQLMKKSGCYRVHIGIEAGNQAILDRVKKGTRIEQIENAVSLVKQADMEVFGCFMLALLDETEATMKQTINFAKKLKLDYAKFTIMTPMPGTELFDYLDSKGLIKHKDWNKFNFSSTAEELYQHPTLSWEVISRTYNRAYRDFYLRPAFVFRRIFYNFNLNRLLNDFRNFMKIEW